MLTPASLGGGGRRGPGTRRGSGTGCCLTVTIGRWGGQPIGVLAQRGQHRQVRVDRIGPALAAAGCAVGLLALKYDQSGSGDRPS